MQNRYILYCSSFFCLLLSFQSSAKTINIPEDYLTIQEGIDNANERDTVLVAPGTYTGIGNKNLDFNGKAIVVKSESGPEQTIIDAEGDGQGVLFHSGEDKNSVFAGFIITGCSSSAMSCIGSPKIRNCIIEKNERAGIYISSSSSVLVEHCIIRDNNQGIDASSQSTNSEAVIKNCLIENNSGDSYGTGIECRNKSPLIMNCTIVNNNTSGIGGGVYHTSSNGDSLNIRNCIVWGNTASSYPNIFSDLPNVSYTNVEGDLLGKGNIDEDPIFVDTLYHIRMDSPCVDSGDPTDDFSKEPQENGGRINMGWYGNTEEALTGTNNQVIIVDITPGEGPSEGGTLMQITGKNFGDNEGKVFFNDQESVITSWTTTAIECTSPAHPSGWVGISVERVDESKDELSYAFRYTGPELINVPDDRSTIQSAIDFATDGDTVLVAAGVYKGLGNKDLDYNGKAIAVVSEAGAEQTIIDAEGDGWGVRFISDEGESSLFSGFTLTGCSSTAIHCSDSPIIQGCIVKDNANDAVNISFASSVQIEGCVMRNNRRGIYSDGRNGDAVIKNCLIVNNDSGGLSGTGIYCRNETPLIINCTIVDNKTTGTIGGVYHSSSSTSVDSLNMRNCIVWGNTAASSYPNIFSEMPNVSYTNVQEELLGKGNINKDPIFVDTLYHIGMDSPSVDSGDPTDDFSNEPVENGGRINMGWYGNTKEATTGTENQVIIVGITPIEGPPEGGTSIQITGENFGDNEGKVIFEDQESVITSWTSTVIECTSPAHPSGWVGISVERVDESKDELSYAFRYTGPELINVPDDRSTIQSAIDFATDGDTVLVAAGVYKGLGNKDLDYNGKAIAVVSEAGAEQTIIDAEGDGWGVRFISDEGESSLFSGFTLTGCSSTAIHCSDSPIIQGCIVKDNANDAVNISFASSVQIEGCVMRNNRRGIYSDGRNGDAVIKNCLIVNNVSGTGIYCRNETPLIINCTIVDNKTTGTIGGVYHSSSSTSVDSLNMRNCIVWGNTAASSYPNIFSEMPNVSYTNVQEELLGKGNINKDPIFVDTLYHIGMDSPSVDSGDPTDDFSNEPVENGGRINMGWYGNTKEATTGTENQVIIVGITPIEGPPEGGTSIQITGENFGDNEGKVIFEDQESVITSWTSTVIECTSPAHPSGWVGISVERVDESKDELSYAFRYTGPELINVPDDRSTIQSAIDFATDGDTVLVAAGVYKGLGNKDLDYNGKAIAVVSEAGAEQTIIDAEGDGWGVRFISDEGESSLFSGFTLTGCSSTAIHCSDSPIIQGCIVKDNANDAVNISFASSVQIEGCVMRNNRRGIYSDGRNGDAVIKNCLIVNNVSGTGIYCRNETPLIINCTIVDNKTTGTIGGVYHSSSSTSVDSLNMRNCIVWGNTAASSYPNIFSEMPNVSYTCLEEAITGEGNITKNPIFIDYTGGDYSLFAASPCIDTGDPSDDFSQESQPNGGRINMGFLGNTEYAASYAPLVKIIDFSFTVGCDTISTFRLEGVNFEDNPGLIMVGNTEIDQASILSWEDTLVVFEVDASIVEGSDITIVNQNMDTDQIPGQHIHTPYAVLVSGEVSGIWTSECPGTYILNGDVVVPEFQSLIIKPGVNILSDGNYKFLVEGSLDAVGTIDSLIIFSSFSLSKQPGDWKGIDLDLKNSNENTELEYCIIEYAENGIRVSDSDVTIHNSLIQKNIDTGVMYVADEETVSGALSNNKIINNEGWGIYMAAYTDGKFGRVNPEVKRNEINNNKLGGIYVEAVAYGASNGDPLGARALADPLIQSNFIFDNGGFGLESYGKGTWSDGLIFDAFYDGEANPIIENNIVAGNNGGVKAYTRGTGDDRWLGYSIPELINCTFWNNGELDILAGDSSTVKVSNTIFWGGETSTIEFGDNGKAIISNSNLEYVYSGAGNISETPQFFNIDSNDFRLFAKSPGIDGGDNEYTLSEEDIFGKTRIADGNADGDTIVDMGAIEYHLPTIFEQPPSQISLCEGEDVTLIVHAEGDNISYQWSLNNQDIVGSNFPELSITKANDGNAGTYICLITDELNGTVSTHPTILEVGEFPEAVITGDLMICEGESTILMATGGSEYKWSTGSEDSTIEVNETNDYTVTVTNEYGCEDETNVSVIVNPKPVAEISGDLMICEGESTILTASGGAEYIWSTGEDDSSIEVDTEGIYTVTVTSNEGCVADTSVELLVHELPEVMLTGDVEICEGESTEITASGGAQYMWNTGEDDSSIEVDTEGIYTVTVTSNEGCVADTSVELLVHELPEVMLTGDLEICEGESTELMASGGAQYMWNTGEDDSSIEVDTEGIYTVTVTSNEGCVADTSVELLVHELPEVMLTGDLEICKGESAELMASGGAQYMWNTGHNTSSIVTSQAGQYTVTVTSDQGCSSNNTVELIVNELPIVSLELPQDTFCTSNEEIILKGGSPEGGDYHGQGITGGVLNPSEIGEGIYTIEYKYVDENACQNSAFQDIEISEDYCTTPVVETESTQFLKVYPNPSFGNILIELQNWHGLKELRVFDLSGRLVLLQKTANRIFEIENLPRGVFIAKISDQRSTLSKKIIVID